jgi:hypothetical protein
MSHESSGDGSAIRHLHTTFRVKKVHELCSSPAERERALEALVDDDDRARPPDEQHWLPLNRRQDD